MYASWRVTLSPIAYNTNLVKGRGRAQGLQRSSRPKWTGKIVKAHPGYSGTIMTATQQLSRDLGWSYFERFAKQKVMQVQSAADPPKKVSAGERAVMADGTEHGEPAAVARRADRGVYAVEGTPLVTGPSACSSAPPIPMRRDCSTPGR